MASDVVQRLNGSIDRLNAALAEQAERDRRIAQNDQQSGDDRRSSQPR